MTDKTMAMTASIDSFLSTYRVRDVAARMALVADDISFEDPVGSPPIVGRAAIERYFQDTVAAGWDIALAPQKIMVNGTEAVAITEVTAGIGDNPPVTSVIVQHFAFDAAGKIKTLRVFMDTPPG
jgi:steroid delta-isomerase